MRLVCPTILAAGAALGLMPMGGLPATAQQGRMICAFNDAAIVARARAHHAEGVTSWDRMASAQRACFYNLNGTVRLEVQKYDVVSWKALCERSYQPGISGSLRVTGSFSISCQ